MSSLEWSSNFEAQAKRNQKIGPNEQYVHVGHVTDSNYHECGHHGYSMCNEGVFLYLDCQHNHLRNHLKGEMDKSSPLRYPQNAKTKSCGRMAQLPSKNLIKGWDS